MALKEEFEKTGNWLFRWRSYFPFLFLPLLLIALKDSGAIERSMGSGAESFWETLCIVISFTGLIFRCLIVGWVPEGTSGRNTKGQLAETINTKGMYSVVRHPLYLGNFFIIFGMILFVQVWWFVLISVLIFWLYYERIMFAEEEFLRNKFGDQFVSWAQNTPAFIPNFLKWQKPDRPFLIRMVLKREYSGFFGIIVAFVALKFFTSLIGQGKIEFSMSWVVFLGIGLAVYATFYYLRKKTKLLHIEKK